jgi:hypothetical protein
MGGDIEALGDLATGAVLAGAVDSNSGASGTGAGQSCQNCGAALTGPYCAACGQKADVHRTLAAFGHDLAHSVFHFDGKIWRTLPLLAWKPGELTRRYVHGERVKFVSPFALFLFSIFLMVAIFSWAGPRFSSLDQTISSADAALALTEDQASLRGEIAKLEKLGAQPGTQNADWIDAELRRTRTLLASLSQDHLPASAQGAAQRRVKVQQRTAEIELARLKASRAESLAAGTSTKAIDEDIAAIEFGMKVLKGANMSMGGNVVADGALKINLGSDALNDLVRHAAENPKLTLYKIQSNAYKFSWALIPISLPFVWLLFFWRRDSHMFDHAVFVTYSIAFMTLLATLCVLAIQWPRTQTAGALALVFYPPFHMYRQLKGAYALSRLGALWRTALLAGFSATALGVFAALILALGLSS